MRRLVAAAAALAAAALAATAPAAAAAFRLTSPAFASGGRIPAVFTCKGANVSPPLRWTAPPRGTRSLALRLRDPDAPVAGGFLHWLGWGLAPRAGALARGQRLPVEGANGAGAPRYTGPCPPSGVHRYRFTLYALDAPLRLRRGAGDAAFAAAIRGHVLARAVLVGRFGS